MAEDSAIAQGQIVSDRVDSETIQSHRVGTELEQLPLDGDIRVLLIEDSAADARLMQEFLMGTVLYQFHLTHVARLAEAFQQLKTRVYDIVLLDLTLPDSNGLGSLERLLSQVPSLPVVVLTNMSNPDLAVAAVRQGAQDYLVKRQLSQPVLVRSLRYAIERKQQSEVLRELNEALEARVHSRTQDLESINQQLRQEVSHRQSVQARLLLAQQAGKIGIFDWDIRTDSMAWPPELAALYEVPQTVFGGRSGDWIQCLKNPHRVEMEQALQRAVSTGTGLDMEVKTSGAAGDRWIVVKTNLFKDDADEPVQMLGIHMDITDKKQLEANFLQAQRLESLGTLASGIAHDLNNILTPILSVSQLLPMMLTEGNNQIPLLLKTLDSSAQRGKKLVQQIVSFSRDGRGFRQVLSLGELLVEIERIVAQTLPRLINIRVEIDPDLWLVEGDDTQLHQVFMNLCMNARDAMPEGGTLKVVTKNLRVDEAYSKMNPDATLGPHVAVVISDTGVGIAPENLSRIFDPFFTTKSSTQGTGLGLAAVLGIVKSHNGLIAVHSTLGEGTQFQVLLPAKLDAMDEKEAALEPLRGQQQLVLVVDDEPAICDVLRLSLEVNGYRVLIAQDGLAAIAKTAEHRGQIDCVLIDLMMSGMDGLTAVPLLQRLQPALPIAVMTGIVAANSTEQVDRLNVQGQLAKPFTTHELLILLKALLPSPSSQ